MSERQMLAASHGGGPAAVLILLAVLLIGTSAGPCPAQITNPVFTACVDEAGGAWDTVFCYNDYGIDLYSGNWRSNLRVGGGQAWIDYNYFTLTGGTRTPADPGDVTPSAYRSMTNTFTLYEPNPYGLPAGALTIEITSESVPATTYLGLSGDR
ncbi:MAG: hypothetical protein GTN78_06730, partial [Gemmatimonadales bacterium]|nr:hypothetical protein [Gemmatimonadales bacterium]